MDIQMNFYYVIMIIVLQKFQKLLPNFKAHENLAFKDQYTIHSDHKHLESEVKRCSDCYMPENSQEKSFNALFTFKVKLDSDFFHRDISVTFNYYVYQMSVGNFKGKDF